MFENLFFLSMEIGLRDTRVLVTGGSGARAGRVDQPTASGIKLPATRAVAAAKSAILGGLLLSLKNEAVRKSPRTRVNAGARGWTVSPMTARVLDDDGGPGRPRQAASFRKEERRPGGRRLTLPQGVIAVSPRPGVPKPLAAGGSAAEGPTFLSGRPRRIGPLANRPIMDSRGSLDPSPFSCLTASLDSERRSPTRFLM
jgi:hypothetical protein